jgi:hypothetical protein
VVWAASTQTVCGVNCVQFYATRELDAFLQHDLAADSLIVYTCANALSGCQHPVHQGCLVEHPEKRPDDFAQYASWLTLQGSVPEGNAQPLSRELGMLYYRRKIEWLELPIPSLQFPTRFSRDLTRCAEYSSHRVSEFRWTPTPTSLPRGSRFLSDHIGFARLFE